MKNNNRIIKFRAWDKIEKRMISKIIVYNSKIVSGYNPFASGVGHLTFEPPTTILMQFIGLKDKNGKEIYEGDIIKTQYVGSEGLKKIKYNITKEFSGFDFIGNLDTSEIIGNIYENPNLIK